MLVSVKEIESYLCDVVHWASKQPDIRAVALVGSFARDAATEDSDIDLVILTNEPGRYLADTQWVKRFGPVAKQQIENYGKLTSVRVWYIGGREVEYGITTPDWAMSPLDDGTRRVVADGIKVLFEREALVSPHVKSRQ